MRTNIVALFRNNAGLIDGFFEALGRHLYPPMVMLDQHSKDGTLDLLTKYARDCDAIINLEQNLPVPEARNIGVEWSAVDVHIFLDSDMLISTSVMPLADNFITYPDAGIVTGTSIAPHNGEMNNGICFAALRRDTYDKIGGFHEGYTLYCDDTEYFESVNRLGLRVYHCPECVGVHIGGMTITHGSESYQREKCLKEDLALLHKRRAILDTKSNADSRRPFVYDFKAAV